MPIIPQLRNKRVVSFAKNRLATTVAVVWALVLVWIYVLDFDVVSTITSFFSGDSGMVVLMVLAGAVIAYVSTTLGLTRRATAITAGAGSIATGVVVGVSGGFLTVGGLVNIVGTAIIAIMVGHPVLIALIGAAVLFFVTDPLAARGGFAESLSFAIKISAVSLLAYLTIVSLGPTLAGVLA